MNYATNTNTTSIPVATESTIEVYRYIRVLDHWVQVFDDQTTPTKSEYGCPTIAFDCRRNKVVCTDAFLDWPEAVKEFAVAHELGHLSLHSGIRADLDIRTLYAMLGECDPYELEADAYAAELVGGQKAIDGLRWLLKKYQKNSSAYNEILYRIRAIQAKYV